MRTHTKLYYRCEKADASISGQVVTLEGAMPVASVTLADSSRAVEQQFTREQLVAFVAMLHEMLDDMPAGD